MKELVNQVRLAFGVKAALDLGLTEALSKGTKNLDQLATENRLNKDHLQRLMTFLIAHGYFRLVDGEYSNNRLSEQLAVGSSVANYLNFYLADWNVASFLNLAKSVQSGESGFKEAHGQEIFDFLSENQTASKVFSAAMEHDSSLRVANLTNHFDFKPFERLIDVGGGIGHILLGVLEINPHLEGILFDLPSSKENAELFAAKVEDQTVAKRASFVGGSFFDDNIPLGDVMILFHILHDWSDENCRKILHSCRASLTGDHARLLICERLIDQTQTETLHLDLSMMALTTQGRERTLNEFKELIDGLFRIERVIETDGKDSVLVCQPFD